MIAITGARRGPGGRSQPWTWVLVLCLCLTTSAGAQSAADLADQIRRVFVAASSAEASQDWLTAERAYRQALELVRVAGDRGGEALALARLAGVQFVLNERDSALTNGRLALAIAEQENIPVLQAAAMVEVAKVHALEGRPDSAMALFQRALPIMVEAADSVAIALVHQFLGNAHHRLGRLDSALVHYRSSRRVWHALHDAAGEAGVLYAVGGLFRERGDLDSMASVSWEAAALFHAAQLPDGEGRVLGQFGLAQALLGHTDSALAWYARSLTIIRAAGDLQAEAEVLRSTAELYRDLVRTDSALSYGFLALDRARTARDPMVEASVQGVIGDIYDLMVVTQGMPADSALTRYRAALSLYRTAHHPIGEAGTLVSIGLVLINVQQPDSALIILRQGLRLADSLEAKATIADAARVMAMAFGALGQLDSSLAAASRALGLARAAGDLMGIAGDLNILAHVHYLRAATATGALEPRPGYNAAAAYFDSSATVIASLRRTAGGDQNRLSVGEYGGGRNQERWVISLLRLGASNAVVAALAVTERGRAQALRDLMQGMRDERLPGAATNADPAVLLASAGQAHAAVIDFLVASDSLMIWLARPGGEVRFLAVPIRADSLQALVARYRAALGVTDAGRGLRDIEFAERSGAAGAPGLGSESAAASLGQVIMAKVLPAELLQHLGEARELIIVPHRSLSLLPFAALQLPGDSIPLGARFAIRYAPSLAALAAVQGRPAPATTAERARVFRKALVVGNPRMPQVTLADGRSGRLPPLPGAAAEARMLAARLGTTLLTADSAGESAVRRRMATAPLIHLATHGFAYSTDARARESFVALAPDSANDGLLTVGEMLDDPSLQLQADLVALSACQTGLGDLKQAEGTVGLQRAFLAKGARSVLVSLWSVSDDATELLMQRFYSHWLDDRDHPGKGEALRRAQSDVRARPEYRQPRFWAAFQLVGAY